MRQLPWTATLIAICAFGCARYVDPRAHGDAADGSADIAEDLPRDAADFTVPDAAADSLPTPMRCTPPERVGMQSLWFAEPALRTDGLVVVGRAPSGYHSSSRSSPTSAFGSWQALSLDETKRDPHFFSFSNQEYVVVAQNPEPRALQICAPDFTGCVPQVVRYASTGQTVVLDMDGPSIANLGGGNLLMAHDIGPGGATTGDIYLATLISPGDLSSGWKTAPVAGLTDPTIKEDDPALSPDGLILLYTHEDGPDSGEIYISRRAHITQPFSPGVPLEDVNSVGYDTGAHLGPWDPPQWELFFESDRSGDRRVYRSICSP